MADAFISYSRRDSAFVARLAGGLTDQGKSVWLDVDGIRDGELFPAALRSAIESSDAFVFVISPDAVASPYCRQEVDHAVELGKRIVPVLHLPTPAENLPRAIRERNWIPLTDQDAFGPGVERLVEALDTDLDWLRRHTHWLVKALAWDGAHRDRSFLLRGTELGSAERWLGEASGKQPEPTDLQRVYIDAGRAAASRRLRATSAASILVALIAIGLLVVTFVARQQVSDERTVAQSKALAAESGNELASDPELSILLARRAVRTSATPEALFALRAALDASTIRRRLPSQPCPAYGEAGAPHALYVPASTLLVETACTRDVVVVDSASGRVVRRLPAVASRSASGDALPLAVNPKGTRVAVATDDGVRIVDPASGRLVARVGHGLVDVVAFTPDGRQLAIHRQGRPLTVWDLRSHRTRRLARTPRSDYLRVTFTPHGGEVLIVANDATKGGLRIYDTRTGALVRNLGAATTEALSPDGSHVAVSSQTGNDGIVTIWSGRRFSRSTVLTRFPIVDPSTLAFSADGERLALGLHDGGAAVWSLRTREQVLAFQGARSRVTALAFSPDGTRVITAARDGTTIAWTARADGVTRIPATDQEPAMMVVNGDRVTASFFSGTASAWDRRTGRLLTRLRLFRGNALAGGFVFPYLSADGSLVVYQRGPGRPVRVMDVRTRRVIHTFGAESGGGAAISDDRTHVAIFGANHGAVTTLRGAAVTPLQHAALGASCGGFATPSFSHDGRLLVASTFCGRVAIWNAQTGQLVRLLTSPTVVFSSPVLSPDARQVAWGSSDGSAQFWSIATGRRVRVIPGHASAVSSVAFDPTGRLVATASLDDTVRVTSLASGRTLRVLRGPDFAPLFSADGRQILTSDAKGAVELQPACPACEDAPALLALAARRTTRDFTPQERRDFLGGL